MKKNSPDSTNPGFLGGKFRYTLDYTFHVPDSLYAGDVCVMNDHVCSARQEVQCYP
ncbi:MAG: hypothetical protein OXF48_01665 [Bacteroidetes bacterium]|nr:hypothetical protein [Bacteroidota bacterium]